MEIQEITGLEHFTSTLQQAHDLAAATELTMLKYYFHIIPGFYVLSEVIAPHPNFFTKILAWIWQLTLTLTCLHKGCQFLTADILSFCCGHILFSK